MLAFPPGGREETFFAFATTAHAWWVGWIIDASEVAFYLAATAGDAGLVDALMLGLLGCSLWRRGGAIGTGGLEGVVCRL
jgi:hypothetical protein